MSEVLQLPVVLDLLTHQEVEATVRACVAAGAPAMFRVVGDGQVLLDPVDPGDRVFESAFNDHQRRKVAARHLLGAGAVATVTDLFESAGWSVRIAKSSRRLDSDDRSGVREWLDAWVGAAVRERPALEEWAEEYLRTRATQLAAGMLRIDIGHQEILAWSP